MVEDCHVMVCVSRDCQSVSRDQIVVCCFWYGEEMLSNPGFGRMVQRRCADGMHGGT